MEAFSHFRSIEELVKILYRERVLLRSMFERRKSLAYRMEFALEAVAHDRERLRLLIDRGVIHEEGDFLELEDSYVEFFEDVLDMNEEISVASVGEYISSLKENITYFLQEQNESRRFKYQANVGKILRKIGIRTLKNVVDLKRSVDVAYKQEPNYLIKKTRLANLDEKRRGIKVMISQCEKIMAEEVEFFSLSSDIRMQRTCMDVRNDFTEADHSLIEIERQIIEYINRIDRQSALFKKIRRLKYLKDQLTWREDTDAVSVVSTRNPLWMEKRQYTRLNLSLDLLRREEYVGDLVRKIAQKAGVRKAVRGEAGPLSEDFLQGETADMESVNVNELWNAFVAQSADLFSFILNYNYRHPRTTGDHVILFCQIAGHHSEDLRFTDNYSRFENIEYALIYAK